MPRSSATTIPAVRKSVSGNLLFNGNFEYLPASNTPMTSAGGTFIDGTATGSSTNTYGWYVYNYSGTRSAQFDTTTSYSGNGSLKLTTNGGTIGVSEAATASWAKNNISCEPNTSYTYSFWIKTNYISGDATTATRFRILQATSAWTVGAGAAIVGVTGLKTSQDWTQYTGTFTTSTTARFLQINMQVVGNDGTATLNMEAWFDNVSITKTTPDTRSTSTIPRRSVENLVFNGDFEYAPAFTAATTTSGKFVDGTAGGTSSANNYGWYTSYTNNAAAQFDSTEKYTGNNSFKLSTTAINSVAQVISVQVPNLSSSSYFELLPNTSYTITFRMKTNYVSGDGRGAFLRHTQYTGDKVSSTGTDSTYIKTTTNWTQYSISFTTASTTRFGLIRLFTWGQDAPATLIMDAWFDDIRLTKTTPDTRTAA